MFQKITINYVNGLMNLTKTKIEHANNVLFQQRKIGLF